MEELDTENSYTCILEMFAFGGWELGLPLSKMVVKSE